MIWARRLGFANRFHFARRAETVQPHTWTVRPAMTRPLPATRRERLRQRRKEAVTHLRDFNRMQQTVGRPVF
jgi:hypothetical protein